MRSHFMGALNFLSSREAWRSCIDFLPQIVPWPCRNEATITATQELKEEQQLAAAPSSCAIHPGAISHCCCPGLITQICKHCLQSAEPAARPPSNSFPLSSAWPGKEEEEEEVLFALGHAMYYTYKGLCVYITGR